MSRLRTSSISEPDQQSTNEAFAYPFSNSNMQRQAGPIEGPGGRRLIRRVTWRSSSYKLLASLWVLGMLYLVWLIRDIFYLPFTPPPDQSQGQGQSQSPGPSKVVVEGG